MSPGRHDQRANLESIGESNSWGQKNVTSSSQPTSQQQRPETEAQNVQSTMQRRRAKTSSSTYTGTKSQHGEESPPRKGLDPGLLLFLLCGIVALSFAISQELHIAKKKQSGVKQQLDDHVILKLEMNRISDDLVALGPHKARVAITKTKCPKPRLWMRLKGDALVSIPMEPEHGDTSRWSASFSFPIAGSYALDVRFYGCDETSTTFKGLKEAITFSATASDGSSSVGQLQQTRSTHSEIFPPGFWLTKKRFRKEVTASIESNYVWFSEYKKDSVQYISNVYQSTVESLGKATVTNEGNPIPERPFNDLSNYELLCFVGSSSAELIREAFLSLRSQVSTTQRPFKFHHYPMKNLTRPEIFDTLGFRKCKNVIVSLDELEGEWSQSDYKQHVAHFATQLTKCVNDTTFPIWLLTVNLPPMVPSPRLCHSPSKHTHNHACNDALFELFEKGGALYTAASSPQIKLLDNTDLSDAHFDDNKERLVDIYSNIAMRIFVLAGHQVIAWRAIPQKGTPDGLMRNGTLEPNIHGISNSTLYEYEVLSTTTSTSSSASASTASATNTT